jgi:carnosine N-methyltransferase
MNNNNLFICLACESKVPPPAGNRCCPHCGQVFLTIQEIPVLVSDTTAYIREMISLYTSFIDKKTDELKSLSGKAGESNRRPVYFETLQQALLHNNALIGEVLEMLLPHLSTRDLLHLRKAPVHNPIFKDFAYLKRDWCGLAPGEEQLSIIECSLQNIVQEHLTATDTALVLGSGLGRIALSLCNNFENVLATDLSFSMIYFFKEILAGREVDFHEVNYNNILRDQDVATPLRASLASVPRFSLPAATNRGGALHSFISDVQKLPLAHQSIDAVFSVYFTDVMAFRLMFKDIDRCLKAGGIFIHFGPLGYNFSDTGEMLAANEIKDFMQERGYIVLKDELVEASHLASDTSLQRTSFRNWVLVARKTTADYEPLSADCLLQLAAPVSYRIEGKLVPGGSDSQSSITISGGNADDCQVSDAFLDIIGYFTEERTVSALLEHLENNYELENRESIINHLSDLVSRRILKKITRP